MTRSELNRALNAREDRKDIDITATIGQYKNLREIASIEDVNIIYKKPVLHYFKFSAKIRFLSESLSAQIKFLEDSTDVKLGDIELVSGLLPDTTKEQSEIGKLASLLAEVNKGNEEIINPLWEDYCKTHLANLVVIDDTKPYLNDDTVRIEYYL